MPTASSAALSSSSSMLTLASSSCASYAHIGLPNPVVGVASNSILSGSLTLGGQGIASSMNIGVGMNTNHNHAHAIGSWNNWTYDNSDLKPKYRKTACVSKEFVQNVTGFVKLTFAYDERIVDKKLFFRFKTVTVEVFGKVYRDWTSDMFSKIHEEKTSIYPYGGLGHGSASWPGGSHWTITTTGDTSYTVGQTFPTDSTMELYSYTPGIADIWQNVMKAVDREEAKLPEDPEDVKKFLSIEQMLTHQDIQIRFFAKFLVEAGQDTLPEEMPEK